jgi:lysophospholipase L1-like esterase
VINRGFGGSHIVDATHFAERIVFPYQPKMIFLRSGGNDITAGKSPEQVFADYKAFVAKVHDRLPNTRIVYISIFPSPSNRPKWEAFKALNALIENYASQQPNLEYLETFDMVLGPDGQPRRELFVEDKLHLNADGYQLLADRVRPILP